jgi:hypothetical protein
MCGLSDERLLTTAATAVLDAMFYVASASQDNISVKPASLHARLNSGRERQGEREEMVVLRQRPERSARANATAVPRSQRPRPRHFVQHREHPTVHVHRLTHLVL